MRKHRTDRRRLAIVLPNLHGGGAETMRVRMATAFADRGVDPEFWLCDATGDLLDEVFQFPVIDLGVDRIRSLFAPLCRAWQDRKPATVLVDMWPNTVVASVCYRYLQLRGDSSRLVVCDHNTLSVKPETQGWARRQFLAGSVRFAYPLAQARLGVSEGVVEDLSDVSGIPRTRFDVIYNPGFAPVNHDEKTDDPWPKSSAKILMVGSLKDQKDHLLALESFSKLEIPDAVLAILGEGALRPSLEKKANELGIADRVLMPGFSKDLAPWYRNADVFLSTSRWEGFGIVIVEAMQFGLSVVSTNCPSGPSEILEGGRHGILVPVGDSDAIACGLTKMLESPTPPNQLIERASFFSMDRVIDQYMEILFPEASVAFDKK